MKKKLTIVALILFFISIANCKAESGAATASMSCSYSYKSGSTNYYLDLKINNMGRQGNVDPTIGSLKIYTATDINSENRKYTYESPFDVDDKFKNLKNAVQIIQADGSTKSTFYSIANVLGYYEYYGKENQNNAETYCPSKIFVVETKDEFNELSPEFYACGVNPSNNIDTCESVRTYVNDYKTKNNVTAKVFDYWKSTGVILKTDNLTDAPNTNHALDTKISVEAAIEKYCGDGPEKDEEKCEGAKKSNESTYDMAEDMGTSKEELDEYYKEFKNMVEIDFNGENNCESYLGNPQDKTHKPPAYYLQFAFNLIKYIAIIMLLVLTIVDFAKAVASSKDEAIKKAGKSTIWRVILAIIIFLLPLLIKFLFTLFGIYSAGTCGIQ